MEVNVTIEDAKASTADVAALFERYHRPIFGYLYRLLGDDAETAQDLTQETFLRLHRSRDRLRDVENERAWIYRIATNLAHNMLRRRRRFAWLPWREVEAPRVPGPGAEVETRQRVEAALLALSPTYRAPLLLYSHDGFSVREIAAILAISESAVKTRLHRARQQFREVYSDE